MTSVSCILLRIARWIVGRDRVEWVDAMEAEAESIRGDSTLWAAGCVAAALRHRVWHERWFVAAIVGLPIVELVLRLLLFFPVVDAGNALGLPGWTFIVVFVLLALPLGFVLGRSMTMRRALLAALLCGVLLEIAGVVQFWIAFGKGPEIWFQPNSHVYNMRPVLGWTTSIAVWLCGALAGSLARRRHGDTGAAPSG